MSLNDRDGYLNEELKMEFNKKCDRCGGYIAYAGRDPNPVMCSCGKEVTVELTDFKIDYSEHLVNKHIKINKVLITGKSDSVANILGKFLK